jgi:hypothetical protein
MIGGEELHKAIVNFALLRIRYGMRPRKRASSVGATTR